MSPAPLSGLSMLAQAELDSLLHNAVEQGALPNGVAIVANRAKTLYRCAIGASPDAIYRIASLTKPITSVAVMILRERGLLDLDDPLERYLPQFAGRTVITNFSTDNGAYTTRAATAPITIRHLLTHTAGFGYPFNSEIVLGLGRRATHDIPLLFEPGSRWMYGCATDILGDLITAITGEPFYYFIDSEILKPLGMIKTSYFLDEEGLTQLVPIYFQGDQGLYKDPSTQPHQPYLSGEAGLLGTAGDYIRFLQMLLNEGQVGNTRLLTTASVTEMISNQIGKLTVESFVSTSPTETLPFPDGADEDKFGLGFQIKTARHEHRRSPGSYSWLGIFNTHFWADPQHGIAAVFFTQLLPCYDDQVMKLLYDFERTIYQHLVTGTKDLP